MEKRKGNGMIQPTDADKSQELLPREGNVSVRDSNLTKCSGSRKTLTALSSGTIPKKTESAACGAYPPLSAASRNTRGAFQLIATSFKE